MPSVISASIHMNERFYKSFRLSPSDHSNHSPLRVADILLDREDDSDGDDADCIGQLSMDGVRERQQRRPGSAAVHYYSPCRIVARLLTMLGRAKKQRQKIQKEPTEFENPSMSASRSVNGLNGSEEPGQYRNDTSFKLGVSCGLLYMIAASKNEFSKMVELRKEMEMLLQHAKEELPRKEAPLKPLKKKDTLACSITDIQDVSSSNSHILVQSQPVIGRNMVHNRFLEYNLSEQDECVEEIHELEAELEVELERLQLYLDEEAAFEDTQQEMVKVTVMDSSTQSHSTSFGEIIDPQEASYDVSFGVHPIELERRLHELLEARLQERITDLEYALECATQKVAEKETEVTWWKDTARLISQHVPETSRFTFRLDPEAILRLKGEH